jgi:hypothetical protein
MTGGIWRCARPNYVFSPAAGRATSGLDSTIYGGGTDYLDITSTEGQDGNRHCSNWQEVRLKTSTTPHGTIGRAIPTT